MTEELQVGQVLILNFRFNNSGALSKTTHPYVVYSIDNENGIVEVIQLDKIDDKKEA